MNVAAPKIAAWVRHEVYLRAARTFIEACESDGIPVLPVKGIVAAYTLYEDPAERALSDVDVRVRKRDYVRVGELAKKRGWRIRETKRAYYNYVIEVEGVDVDVECAVGPPHVCGLTIEEMLSRASPSPMFGFDVRLPSFVDHVVLQLVNLFKDKLVCARDAAQGDLQRIAQHPDFDVNAIVHRLERGGVTTLGWIVADYATRTSRIARWGELRERLGTRRKLYTKMFAWSINRPSSAFTICVARAASDNFLSRTRALATMARWGVEAAFG